MWTYGKSQNRFPSVMLVVYETCNKDQIPVTPQPPNEFKKQIILGMLH